AVLDDRGGNGAGVPEQGVEVGDVDHPQVGQVGPVGGGVAHVVDATLGRVVLDVDGGDVEPGTAPAQPVLGQVVELLRALEDDDVDLIGPGPGLGRCDLDRVGRPVPRAGPPPTVGTPVGKDGNQPGVRAVDEGGGPRPVDVPHQHVHPATARRGTGAGPASAPTAPSTSATLIEARHGWPATGQTLARHPAHGTL